MNHAMTEGLALLAIKCVECGCVRFLAVGVGVRAEDLIQARWNAAFAQLTHGGWVCWSCIEANADRSLLPAAEAVRETHRRIRVVQVWSTETVRGRR